MAPAGPPAPHWLHPHCSALENVVARLFPNQLSDMCRCPEIAHGVSIYAMEIHKSHKSGLRPTSREALSNCSLF